MIYKTHKTIDERRSARFSDGERYRYTLEIIWDETKPLLIGVCLNPSTATHLVNDPTVERCCRRARMKGYGGFVMLNLFAFRATEPKDMKSAADPIWPDNDCVLFAWFEAAASQGWTVMLGWGAHGSHRGRDQEVLELMRRAGVTPVCLEVTGAGQPKHPLYVGYDKPFLEWAA